MNIIDAIKSGLPFRRVAWDISEWWIQPKAVNYLPRLRSVDILADDWEIEEVSCYAGSAMITREQFNAAWDNSLRDEPRNNLELHTFLIKHLGL
jgi:hypothetical protein